MVPVRQKNLSRATDLFHTLEDAKQDKIFQAAVDEFATRGYSGASVNRLVRRAGISKGSLFTYFRTKRDLFDGLVSMATGRVKDYLKTVRDGTLELELMERLERVLRAGFDFIDTHPRLARIYFHLLHSGDAPFGIRRLQELHRRSREFLVEILQQSAERGDLPTGLDLERTAFLINALFEQLLRAYYIAHLTPARLGLHRGKGSDLEQWIGTTMTFIERGLREEGDRHGSS